MHVLRDIACCPCNAAVPAASSVHKLQQAEIKLQAFKVYHALAKCTSLPSREKVPFNRERNVKCYQPGCDEFLYRLVGDVQPSVTEIPVAT